MVLVSADLSRCSGMCRSVLCALLAVGGSAVAGSSHLGKQHSTCSYGNEGAPQRRNQVCVCSNVPRWHVTAESANVFLLKFQYATGSYLSVLGNVGFSIAIQASAGRGTGIAWQSQVCMYFNCMAWLIVTVLGHKRLYWAAIALMVIYYLMYERS